MRIMTKLYKYKKFELEYKKYLNEFKLSSNNYLYNRYVLNGALPLSIYDIGHGKYKIQHGKNFLFLENRKSRVMWNVIIDAHNVIIDAHREPHPKNISPPNWNGIVFAWFEPLNKLIYEYLKYKGLLNEDNNWCIRI